MSVWFRSDASSVSLLLNVNPCGKECELLRRNVAIVNTSYGSVLPFAGRLSLKTAEATLPNGTGVWIASAGNESKNAGDHFPSAIPSVISVGATNYRGQTAWFSNFGAKVDIMAPGTDIPVWHQSFSSSTFVSGTSFSAPLVAGIVSLMKSAYPSEQVANLWNWKVAKYVLQKTARPMTCESLCPSSSLYNTEECRKVWCNDPEVLVPGLVDAYAAVLEATKGLPRVPLIDSDRYLLDAKRDKKIEGLIKDISVGDGVIYVATKSGLYLVRDNGKVVEHVSTDKGLGSNEINRVQFIQGGLYASTENGLSISTDGGKIFVNRTKKDGLGSNKVYAVFKEGKKIYVATKHGLSISEDAGRSFTNIDEQGLGHYWVTDVAVSNGTIYAATISGLSISNDGGKSFVTRNETDGLGSFDTRKVVVENGNIYVATDSGISISYDGGSHFTNYTTEQGLGSNYVDELFVQGGTIYIGTPRGLSIGKDPNHFVTTLNSEWIDGVVVNKGIIYAATRSAIFTSADGGRNFDDPLDTRFLTLINRGGASANVSIMSDNPNIIISPPTVELDAVDGLQARQSIQIKVVGPMINKDYDVIRIRATSDETDYVDRHEVFVTN